MSKALSIPADDMTDQVLAAARTIEAWANSDRPIQQREVMHCAKIVARYVMGRRQ